MKSMYPTSLSTCDLIKTLGIRSVDNVINIPKDPRLEIASKRV